ncbi:MAG TPA: type IV secretion system protein [Novosphingobium sp.]|nr:type IV secretion system protein [Novosphingobium sp.]
MATQCTDLVNAASAGIAPALRAVDCVAGELTASAFNRLFGAEGAMAPVLTILLTLFIAFFAISLLTGRSTLSISALTPRMMTLGLVLTFATSWVAYQGVVWNLAVAGPDWIAGVLMGTKGSATQIFADRIDIVFNAIAQLASAGAGTAAPGAEGAAQAVAQNVSGGGGGMFKPADVMWLGALLLLLGTVGVLLTARIALALLLALGPIFVVMALFGGTRGLTAGWLRGVVLTALVPLFVVLGGGITLELLVPVLNALAENAVNGISGRAAMSLFLIASVHVALMGMMLRVATTMVMGWQVFGLARGDRVGRNGAGTDAPGGALAHVAPLAQTFDPDAGAFARRAPLVTAVAADGGSGATGGEGTRASERRTLVTHVTGGGVAATPAGPATPSRARGIGSRFRSASNDTGPRSQTTPAGGMMK